MTPLLLAVFFYLCSAVAKAACDTMMFRYDTSVFQRWPQFCNLIELSWRNKYETSQTKPGIRIFIKGRHRLQEWYYRTFNLKYYERFPGSATVFVFLTDGWHLAGFLRALLTTASIWFAFHVEPEISRTVKLIAIAVIMFGDSVVFQLFYSKYFLKK